MEDCTSTSGIVQNEFISHEESLSSYTEITCRGFNSIYKVKRHGKWFVKKGLKPEFVNQKIYVELLKKEYDLSSQLEHPNIVRVFDKENDPKIGPCIVMEYVDGLPLDAFLATNPDVQVRKRLVSQFLDAMCYYHAKQIVHRDLKPSNVLVTRNGSNLKIIDFGLSDADSFAILKQPAGTPKYAAPEQMQQDVKIDGRADIFAFGKLLKMIFPNRYGHIAAKCQKEDREKRWKNAEALRKAFVRRQESVHTLPMLLCVCLAIGSFAWALLRQPETIVVEKQVEGFSSEQQAYIAKAEKALDSLYKPYFAMAEKVGVYKEIMIVKMTEATMASAKMCDELAARFPLNSLEYQQFFNQYALMNNERIKQMNRLSEKCRSFVEDYQKGLIDKETYNKIASEYTKMSEDIYNRFKK